MLELGVALWLTVVANICCDQAPSGVTDYTGWVTTRVLGDESFPYK